MKRNERGITLIALIITVIVLLILAGTAIGIALNGGDIFGKASQAREGWNVAVEKEESTINQYLNYIKQMPTKVTDENPGTLEGAGTLENPWTINSIEDLVAFSYNVNSGTTYEDQYVTLGLTLDFNNNDSYKNPETKYSKGEYGHSPNESGNSIKQLLTDTTKDGFIMIGNSSSYLFEGSFDGNNYAIKNLYEKTSNYGGLFGISAAKEIKNLVLENCTIEATNDHVASLVGWTKEFIQINNCHVSGIIQGCRGDSGGLIGYVENGAEIKNCSCNMEITATNSCIGGIIGTSKVSLILENSNNLGNIISNWGNELGGLIGYGYGEITINNCFNSGNVKSNNEYYIGGILGNCRDATIIIANTYNTGDIEASGESSMVPAGGIVGFEYSNTTLKVYNCYNTGHIISTSRTGGIVGCGSAGVEIKNCYNLGEITAKRDYSGYHGGIAGYGTDFTIDNCYNRGIINNITTFGENVNIGGIAGSCNNITNCHNSGNIEKGDSTRAKEICKTDLTDKGCTYLYREENGTSTNVDAYGSTEVKTTDNTFNESMTSLLSSMNAFVNANNAVAGNVKLKTWVIGSDGYPVWE